MMNFGLRDLVLVDPCKITDEALARAMHAAPILRAARTYKTLDEALATLDHSIATTCEPSRKDRKHLRKALLPWDFARLLPALGGKVGILLGREDFGLFNTEIEKCDIVVTIPTTTEYKSMNLSHAAAIIFYELSKAMGTGRRIWPMKEATGLEKEVLFRKFQEYLNDIGYPAHKRKNTTVLFKRLIGRSALSGWEFHTFTGVFTMGSKRIAIGVPRVSGGYQNKGENKGKVQRKGKRGKGRTI